MNSFSKNMDHINSLLAIFPRVELANIPTPLEKMQRLSEHIAGPTYFAKRDDLTGFAGGGNKARQLEYSFGDAMQCGADMILVTGAVQSNYVRSAAAAAAKFGLSCHVQLENRVGNMPSSYHRSGNVLLNKLFGAKVSTFHIGEDEAAADANIADLAKDYIKKGKKPYLLTLSPDTKPLGTLGYMRCAGEILDQLHSQKKSVSAIVVASGSAATHVGLLLGLRLLKSEIPVHGICVRRNQKQQTSRVRGIVRLAENLIGCGEVVQDSDIKCHDDWLRPGYGKTNEFVRESMTLAGNLEGMVVDPVYTAKSFAGVIGLYREGVFNNGQNILYLHTGGMPAIFAYEDEITEQLNDGLSTKNPNHTP